MHTYILSIVGVVFIGVLSEIILPEGKTNSFIRHILSLFLLFAIVAPIPKFLNLNFNFMQSSNTSTDDNFLHIINQRKVEELEKSIINRLTEEGIEKAEVIVSANVFSQQFSVSKIYVDISMSVLKKDFSHNDIKEVVTTIVRTVAGIAKEDVIVYG